MGLPQGHSIEHLEEAFEEKLCYQLISNLFTSSYLEVVQGYS